MSHAEADFTDKAVEFQYARIALVTLPPDQSTSNQADVWTVRRILDWTTAHLTKHGSDSPRLDAEILLAHSRGCQRIELYTRYDEVLTDVQRATMRDLVRRRAQAEPVAYLVGHREFFGLEFNVTSDVLIPRPDTETLVMAALDFARPRPSPKVLDLCTGSGCIAVVIAKNLASADITATDLSEAALSIAHRNAERHSLDQRITFSSGDLFDAVDPDRLFDVIVSNPPYVTTLEMDTIQPDVRLHEPHLALEAGADGLDVVRRIVDRAHRHLVAGGGLFMEFSPEQADTVAELLCADGHYRSISIVNDLSARPRVVSAIKNF